MIYALARLLTRLALRAFYRLEVRGAPPAPGAVLFGGNHPNGLLDPMLLIAACPYPIAFLAKEPLFRIPLLGALIKGMRALPVYRAQDGHQTGRNAGTLSAASDALARGQPVAIFPEGISHSLPRVFELKTGAARMVIAAREQGAQVTLLPFAVIYADKQRFRSRALLTFGEPVVHMDTSDPGELTERLRAGIRAAAVETEAVHDLQLVERIERLYRAERGGHQGLAAAYPRWKRIVEAAALLGTRDPDRLDSLRRRLGAYLSLLDRLGLTEHDVSRKVTPGRVLQLALARLLPLGLGLPLAAAGALAFFLPYKAPAWLTRALQPSPDMTATYKVLTGLVCFLAVYAGLLVLAALTWGVPAAAVAALLLPALGLYTLTFREAADRAAQELTVLLRLAGRRELRERLQERRAELVAELEALDGELS